MRFISQYPNYVVQVRQQKVRPLGDGTSETLDPGLYAKFVAADAGGMVYERERYGASEHFVFHGMQQEQDQATPVDVIHRLSVLDTAEAAQQNGWTAEEQAAVEARLMQLATYEPNSVMVVEGTPIPAPFPKYDVWDGDPQELVIKLTEDGHDLNEVLIYERQFGKNRPEVIAALQLGAAALEELTVRG